jgi:uncharacterized membrane protein YdjX (TVP38/TMEM64 family)
MESITQHPPRHWTKKHYLMMTGLVLALGGLAVLLLGPGVTDAINAVIAGLRVTGPVVFFVAMAFLPALGFPLLAFTLAAGPVFSPVLGTGGVIACSLAAVLANLLLTYWLSHRALRPLVSRLLARLDFHLPESAAGDAWQLTLIVRLMPGPPFWVQSYLLGLLRVPLVPYLMVSMLVLTGYIVALITGAEALASGNGRLAFAAVGVLAITVAGLQLWRHRTARHQAAANLPLVIVPPTAHH